MFKALRLSPAPPQERERERERECNIVQFHLSEISQVIKCIATKSNSGCQRLGDRGRNGE
jgi:hypothetical protein